MIRTNLGGTLGGLEAEFLTDVQSRGLQGFAVFQSALAHGVDLARAESMLGMPVGSLTKYLAGTGETGTPFAQAQGQELLANDARALGLPVNIFLLQVIRTSIRKEQLYADIRAALAAKYAITESQIDSLLTPADRAVIDAQYQAAIDRAEHVAQQAVPVPIDPAVLKPLPTEIEPIEHPFNPPAPPQASPPYQAPVQQTVMPGGGSGGGGGDDGVYYASGGGTVFDASPQSTAPENSKTWLWLLAALALTSFGG